MDQSQPIPNDAAAAAPKLITAEELAPLLAVSASTVRRMAENRLIPSYSIGGSVRFDPDEALAAIRKNYRRGSVTDGTSCAPVKIPAAVGAAMDGDEGVRALIAVACHLAGKMAAPSADKRLRAIDFLDAAQECGLAGIIAGGARSPVHAMGWRLATLPGRTLKDSQGREFEVLASKAANGTTYRINFF